MKAVFDKKHAVSAVLEVTMDDGSKVTANMFVLEFSLTNGGLGFFDPPFGRVLISGDLKQPLSYEAALKKEKVQVKEVIVPSVTASAKRLRAANKALESAVASFKRLEAELQAARDKEAAARIERAEAEAALLRSAVH